MAKVILSSGDTSYVIANTGDEVLGASGNQTLEIQAGVTGISANSTIEQINFSSVSSQYTFKTNGAGDLDILDTNGNILVQLKSAAGKTLSFGGEVVSVESSGFDASTGTAGLTVNGAAVEIAETFVTITPDTTTFTATATSASDAVTFSDLSTGNFTITDFNTTNDKLVLSGLTGASGSNLSELDGDTISTGQIGVQVNQIKESLFVNLGQDTDGDVISIEVLGVTDASLVTVELA